MLTRPYRYDWLTNTRRTWRSRTKRYSARRCPSWSWGVVAFWTSFWLTRPVIRALRIKLIAFILVACNSGRWMRRSSGPTAPNAASPPGSSWRASTSPTGCRGRVGQLLLRLGPGRALRGVQDERLRARHGRGRHWQVLAASQERHHRTPGLSMDCVITPVRKQCGLAALLICIVIGARVMMGRRLGAYCIVVYWCWITFMVKLVRCMVLRDAIGHVIVC